MYERRERDAKNHVHENTMDHLRHIQSCYSALPTDRHMAFLSDQPPGLGQCRVIRRPIINIKAKEGSQAERISHTPSDSTVTIESFKETDEHHPKVNPGRQRRSSHFRVITLQAFTLADFVKLRFREQLVHPLIEWMARGFRDFASLSKALLFRFRLLFAYQHGPILSHYRVRIDG